MIKKKNALSKSAQSPPTFSLVYSIPRTALINYNKLGDLNVFSQFCGLEV